LAVFSHEDPIAGIRILFDYAEQNEEKPVVKIGLVEGNITSASDLKLLSNLPSREQLLASVAGGLKTPLNKFVGVLGGVQRNFVFAIAAIAKQKESK
jgi:large subunit ribosomal protein L10